MSASFLNRALLFLVVTSLAFVLWLWVPHALTEGLQITPVARLTLENQLRDTGAKFVWAALTLGLAALAWNHLRAMSKVVENSAQTLSAAEQKRLAGVKVKVQEIKRRSEQLNKMLLALSSANTNSGAGEQKNVGSSIA